MFFSKHYTINLINCSVFNVYSNGMCRIEGFNMCILSPLLETNDYFHNGRIWWYFSAKSFDVKTEKRVKHPSWFPSAQLLELSNQHSKTRSMKSVLNQQSDFWEAGFSCFWENIRSQPDIYTQMLNSLSAFSWYLLQVMMMGNSKIASLLLEKGADPNLQDRHGVVPAHDAAHTGFLDTLQVLVEYGASVNIPDQRGALPIHFAIQEGHRDVVEFLAPRSDLKHTNINGQTAIDVARASCVPDMIDLLFAHIHS